MEKLQITFNSLNNIGSEKCFMSYIQIKLEDPDTECFYNFDIIVPLKNDKKLTLDDLENLSFQKVKMICQKIIDDLE